MLNDEHLSRYIRDAASPVAVLFIGGEEPARDAFVLHRFSELMDDFLQQIIFVQIRVDENPTPAREFSKPWHIPEIVIFRRRIVVGRLYGSFTRDEIEGLLRVCLREGVK